MADPSTHRHLMNLFAESPPGACFALGACRGPEWSGVSSAVLEKHPGPQAGRGQRAWSGQHGKESCIPARGDRTERGAPSGTLMEG